MRLSHLAAILAVALLSVPLAAADAGRPAPKIGVLRLAEVLNGAKLYRDGTDQLKRDDAEFRAELKKMDERLQQLDGQLQVLTPASDKYASIQEEFETLKLKRKLSAERASADIQRKHVALVKRTHRALRAALRAFCEERGVMLVLLAPNPELTAPTLQDVQLEMGLQSVLYYEPSNDITEAFLPFFNARGEAPAAPAAGAAGAAGAVDKP